MNEEQEKELIEAKEELARWQAQMEIEKRLREVARKYYLKDGSKSSPFVVSKMRSIVEEVVKKC